MQERNEEANDYPYRRLDFLTAPRYRTGMHTINDFLTKKVNTETDNTDRRDPLASHIDGQLNLYRDKGILDSPNLKQHLMRNVRASSVKRTRLRRKRIHRGTQKRTSSFNY